MKLQDRMPSIGNPRVFDALFQEIQSQLVNELDWLDYAFGKAQRLVKVTEQNKRYVYPGVYAGVREYLDVTPNDRFGNFSFFLLSDPQTLTGDKRKLTEAPASFSLIFWLDLRKIEDVDNRGIDELKESIFNAVMRGRYLSGRVTLETVMEQADNIYRGFTIDEVANQYLMHPFAGLRFEGTMQLINIC